MVSAKVVGGVRPQPPAVRQCGEPQPCRASCVGSYAEGNWIHSAGCPSTVILWASHGWTATDWACPHGCPPQDLGSGWTHQYDCTFWKDTDATPFD